MKSIAKQARRRASQNSETTEGGRVVRSDQLQIRFNLGIGKGRPEQFVSTRRIEGISGPRQRAETRPRGYGRKSARRARSFERVVGQVSSRSMPIYRLNSRQGYQA